ncbi:MAG: hypothetical protein FJ033_16415 [Chloroflexi bacterium]|nr:hypothetical protein [Chloroflexota bacterium]
MRIAAPSPGTQSAEATAIAGLGQVVPRAARINWANRLVTRTLAEGEAIEVFVDFAATQPIAGPQVTLSAAAGIVVDPASIPARIEPGRPYTLRLVLSGVPGQRAARTGVIQIAPTGGRGLDERLIVRLVPRL